MAYPLAWFGPENMIIVAVIGLLIFGRRLPEVGRSLGKGIVEFKKGLQGIEDDIDTAVKKPSDPTTPVSRQLPENARNAALEAGYKFDPITGKPLQTEQAMRFDPYTGKPLQTDPVTGQPMRFDPYTGKPLTEEAAASQGRGPDVGA